MASSFAPAISATNGSGVMSSTGGANVSSSSDLLAGDEDLSQILQQATELQNDLSSGQLYEQPTAVEDINLSNVLEVVSFFMISVQCDQMRQNGQIFHSKMK